MKRTLALALFTVALSGCSVFHAYRPDVSQGNVITKAQVAQLKLGMSQRQVISIMGEPVLQNVFANNRISYVYTFWPNRGASKYKKAVLSFRRDRLIKIEKQFSQ